MKTAQGAIARLLQGVKYRRLALAPTAVLAALVYCVLSCCCTGLHNFRTV